MVREEELVQKAKEVREALIEMAADEVDATHIEVGQIKAKDDTRKLLTVRVGGANRYVPYQGHDTSEFTVGDYWAIIFDDYGTIRLGWWVTNNAGGGTIPFRPHNLLDSDAHPDTVAQGVTRGSVIVGDSTPEWNKLVIGLAARYLRSDGTDPAYAQIPASEVVNTPAGGIAATDVQAAINELEVEKATITHKDTHKLAGADAFLAADLVDAVVRRLRETGGPTDMLLGAIANGEYLKRVGATIVGAAAVGGGWTQCARVYRNSDQAIPNGAWTAISFSHERFDTDNIWVIGNPTRLTCRTAGIYSIIGNVRFESINVGTLILTIRENGITQWARVVHKVDQATTHTYIVSSLVELSVTDYVEFVLFQSSGGVLDIDYIGGVELYSPDFMMAKVG